MSSYADQQHSKFSRLESILYDTYGRTKMCQMDFDKFLETKNSYHDNPLFDGLSSYYKGKLSGIDSCLFKQIQKEHTEWLHYYVGKRGKTVYVDKWEKLPKYIKNNGNFFGNHFWKRTKDQIKGGEEPRPFGHNPSKGMK